MNPEEIAIAFIKAFEQADLAKLRELMAEDVINHVTTREGTSNALKGREAYIESVKAMDIPSAKLNMSIPQILTIEPGRVLVMVEVKAERDGKTLHNFAGLLCNIQEGVITQTWMVEALPEGSDEFWKST